MPRSNSTSYLGNPKIKNVGVTQQFTLQQLTEYQKCSEDPIYFIKNYVKIVNVDRGEIPFELYDFQEKMVMKFVNNRFNIVKCPRQVGKCLVEDACLYIRDRKTGQEKNVTIKEFFELNRPSFLQSMWSAISNWLKLKGQVLHQRMPANSTNAKSS